jgi:hypothetical protein
MTLDLSNAFAPRVCNTIVIQNSGADMTLDALQCLRPKSL